MGGSCATYAPAPCAKTPAAALSPAEWRLRRHPPPRTPLGPHSCGAPRLPPFLQVFSLSQGRRDIDAVYSMGLFEDVSMRPTPADGSSVDNPKVGRAAGGGRVCDFAV